MQSTDYYLLLLFHVDASGTARSSLNNIKGDCRTSVRDSGVGSFSSILPVKKQRGLKGPVVFEESAGGYRPCATARDLTS